MIEPGKVQTRINGGIAEIIFSHPKGNSLPGTLLREIASAVTSLGEDTNARVIILRSEGERVFCGGASFDELKSVKTVDEGQDFFMGFGRLILAMRDCPKFIIARVQGKVVGGGVGVVSAADYSIATRTASFRLSELALGLGPFIIGPAVLRRVGTSAFHTLTIDADWHDAEWAEAVGFYSGVVDDQAALDAQISKLAQKLAESSPDAMARIKKVLWEGTEHWGELLPKRARISAELVLTEHCRRLIAAADSSR